MTCGISSTDLGTGPLDYDRILVLDLGRVVEFDTPKSLLGLREGAFRRMCERSGDWEKLKTAAGYEGE
jgi:hypothetical protein